MAPVRPQGPPYGTFLTLRYRDLILGVCASLSRVGMLHDRVARPRTSLNMDNHPPPHHRRSLVAASSASTPSLRSRDGTLPQHMKVVDGGGNVKVVVRVRAFLPRGESESLVRRLSCRATTDPQS